MYVLLYVVMKCTEMCICVHLNEIFSQIVLRAVLLCHMIILPVRFKSAVCGF